VSSFPLSCGATIGVLSRDNEKLGPSWHTWSVHNTSATSRAADRLRCELSLSAPHRAETIVLALQPILRRIKRQINRKRSSSLECVCVPPSSNSGKADAENQQDLLSSPRPSHDDNLFSFVYTKSRCSRKAVPDHETQLLYEYHTKPLRKVWRRNSMKKLGWSPKNTLILEDTPQNCVSNYGNALYIRTYDVTDLGRQDMALLVLQAFLDRLRHVEDVRTIEKRDWERLCASTLKQTPHPLMHAMSAPTVTLCHSIATPRTPRCQSSSGPSTSSDGGMYAAILTPRTRNTSKYNPIAHHHNAFYDAEHSSSEEEESDFSCDNNSDDADTDDDSSSNDSEIRSPPTTDSDSDTEDDFELITPRRRSGSLDLPSAPHHHSGAEKPVLPFQGFKLRTGLPNHGKDSALDAVL